MRWIPGHSGNKGNKAVDEEAKQAAKGETSDDKVLPARYRSRRSLPASKSAVKQAFYAKLKVRGKAAFEKSPRYAKISRIDNSLPSNKYRKLIKTLPRKHASILTQLRTGHAPLKHHLHRIKCADSPICPSCEMEPETTAHFLIFCPAHEKHRRPLRYEFKRDAKNLAVLLNSRDALKPLFRFIHQTGRFHEAFGGLELPERTDDEKAAAEIGKNARTL